MLKNKYLTFYSTIMTIGLALLSTDGYASDLVIQKNEKVKTQKKQQVASKYDPIAALLRGDTSEDLRPNGHATPWQQITFEYDYTVNGLIKVLNKKKLNRDGKGPVIVAVMLLGELRAKKAVKPLSKMISYQPKYYQPADDLDCSTFYYFPAAVSLGQIGQPAMRTMLEIIESEKSTPLDRKLAAWVLTQILYDEDYHHQGVDDNLKPEVILPLKERIKTLKGQPRKNLQEAIDFIKSFKDVGGPPEKVPGFLKPIEKKKKKK